MYIYIYINIYKYIFIYIYISRYLCSAVVCCSISCETLDFFCQMVQTVIISVLIRCTSRNTGREGRLVMREIRAVASSDVVK